MRPPRMCNVPRQFHLVNFPGSDRISIYRGYRCSCVWRVRRVEPQRSKSPWIPSSSRYNRIIWKGFEFVRHVVVCLCVKEGLFFLTLSPHLFVPAQIKPSGKQTRKHLYSILCGLKSTYPDLLFYYKAQLSPR